MGSLSLEIRHEFQQHLPAHNMVASVIPKRRFNITFFYRASFLGNRFATVSA